MKICYSILNYSRKPEVLERIVQGIPDWESMVIATNKPQAARHDPSFHCLEVLDCRDTSIAKAKNMIIDYAKKNKFDYLFILEDDAVVTNQNIFAEYIKLMTQYKIGFTMYGFGRETNVIFGVPNPALVLESKTQNYIFNRIPYGMICGFDLKLNDQKFDEKYNMIELKEYVIRLNQKGIIKHLGFFPDVLDSHTMVDHIDDERTRISDIRLLFFEQQKLEKEGKQYRPSENLEPLLKWVKDVIDE